MKQIYLHYCGGCNPRYDRTALAAQLKRDFPQYIYTGEAEPAADLELVLCGCTAACPARRAAAAKDRCVVTHQTDRAALYAVLASLEEGNW